MFRPGSGDPEGPRPRPPLQTTYPQRSGCASDMSVIRSAPGHPLSARQQLLLGRDGAITTSPPPAGLEGHKLQEVRR